jgi:hypothetical protein
MMPDIAMPQSAQMFLHGLPYLSAASIISVILANCRCNIKYYQGLSLY